MARSELFGHERGAFTGAHQQKRGMVEEADGGTLLIDDLQYLSLEGQELLLGFIQTGEFRRIGGGRDIESNTRIIVAINEDPRRLRDEERLLPDLFDRLRIGGVISLPRLAARQEDIPRLAEYFLQMFNERRLQLGLEPCHLTPEAVEALTTREWPGNVRALEGLMFRTVVEADTLEIGPDELITADVAEYDQDDICENEVAEVRRILELRLDRVKDSQIKRVFNAFIDSISDTVPTALLHGILGQEEQPGDVASPLLANKISRINSVILKGAAYRGTVIRIKNRRGQGYYVSWK